MKVIRNKLEDLIYRVHHEDLVPPPRMIQEVGGGGVEVFKQVGHEFCNYFIELCSLRRDAKVLDVGCGAGRMAIPLTAYLEPKGSYEGFDIIKHQIEWCSKEITPRYPAFHFQLANVFNGTYNPKGRFKASEYQFPYPDECFDLVFLTSVFTHMMPEDVSHYVSEIARVLKSDGRSLMTFFLLNEPSRTLMKSNASSLSFVHDFGDWATTQKELRESAVAYDERYVRQLFELNRLRIREPICYGHWCGSRSAGMRFSSYQDMVIAQK